MKRKLETVGIFTAGVTFFLYLLILATGEGEIEPIYRVLILLSIGTNALFVYALGKDN